MLLLRVDDYLITTTTAVREGGQAISHPPHMNILSLTHTHTQHERPDQAPSRTTDDYTFIRQIVSGFGLRTPPKSQPQVPAPACPLAHAHSHAHRIHITLLHFFCSRPLPRPTLQPTTSKLPLSSSCSHTHPLSRHPSSTTPTTTTHSLTSIHPTPPTTTTMYLLTSTIQQPSCARMPTL